MLTIIADSGSTKTDWVLVDKNEVLLNIKTSGFNPYFQTKEQITNEINLNLKPSIQNYLSGNENVHYYGAGCSNSVNSKIVAEAVSAALDLKNIEINHDLLAAARALCGNEQGIACILGTGSNSCLYDGNKVLENVPSVGYMFGDDGSGAHIGKTFIQAYFDNVVPEKLKSAFEQAGFHREEILDNIYKKPMPSKYLASISKFLAPYSRAPYVKQLIKNCFMSFFDKQIGKYTNSRDYIVHSVGSVGFFYKDILFEVTNEKGYKMGKIIKSPIEGLIEYHQSLLL